VTFVSCRRPNGRQDCHPRKFCCQYFSRCHEDRSLSSLSLPLWCVFVVTIFALEANYYLSDLVSLFAFAFQLLQVHWIPFWISFQDPLFSPSAISRRSSSANTCVAFYVSLECSNTTATRTGKTFIRTRLAKTDLSPSASSSFPLSCLRQRFNSSLRLPSV
jgi:hypothetical protein